MPSSFTFTGSGFYVVSASQVVPGTVRVRYSSPPKAVSSVGPTDALNVTNYNLTGTGPYGILSVSPVSGDSLSYDIVLSGALSAGMWVLTVSNVQNPSNAPLSNPNNATFFVTVTASQTDLTAGAEQDDAERIIRKHLNKALTGKNWNAIIKGLSTGDNYVWDVAQKAYDQLFLSSASGRYLEARASDVGITKPSGVGISEPVFRKFAIKSNASKVVQQSIREVLEAFYGEDSLRAYAEAELDETYNLSSPLSLDWVLDETETFSYTFVPGAFAVSTKARAIEVAVQLTKYMQDLGSRGFATAFRSPETGKYKVRIYSGSLGLRSSVRISGGTSQNIFRFPNYIEVYSSTVTSGSGYTWVHTNPDQDTSCFSLTAAGSSIALNLSPVQAGDYVVVGQDAQWGVTGVFAIKSVEITWAGSNIVQKFCVDKVSTTGGLTQLSNDAYRFFRPKKRTTNAGSRTIVVSQSVDGRLDVSIPATTQAVARGPKTAWYGRVNDSVNIKTLNRNFDGLVTVETDSAHGLNAGSFTFLDEVEPTPFRLYTHQDLTTGTTKAPVGFIDSSQVATAPGTAGAIGASSSPVGTTNDFCFTGGYVAVSSPSASYNGESAVVHRISGAVGSALLQATEVDGRVQNNYTWSVLGTLNTARVDHGQSSMGSSSLLVTGGFQRAGTTFLNSCERLSGSSFVLATPMTTARAGHSQIRLNNGNVLVVGGCNTPGLALNSVELYNTDTDSWTTRASMSVGRVNFKAIKMADGRVLVTGGRPLARLASSSSSVMLARWLMNESSGNSVADDLGVYGLTTINGPTIRQDGKVGNCRDFNFSNAHAIGAGDLNAINTLLGEWTVTLWAKRTTFNTAGEFISFGGDGSGGGGAAENLLMNIGISSSDFITWKWEHSLGIDVGGTSSNTIANLGHREGWNHIALRKTFASAGFYNVSLFINGRAAGTWSNQTNATDGSSGSWYLARNPQNVTSGFQGLIDTVTVYKKSLSDGEILKDWRMAWGTYQTEWDNSRSPDYGESTNLVEIYDPNANTWTALAPMNEARAFHDALLLSDGRVLVCGGLGGDLTQNDSRFVNSSQNGTFTEGVGVYPNKALTSCEIYDPVSDKWELVGNMGIGRKGLAIVSSPTTNEVFAFGGSDQRVYDKTVQAGNPYRQPTGSDVVEVMNLSTMKWQPALSNLTGGFQSYETSSTQGLSRAFGSMKTVAYQLVGGTIVVNKDWLGEKVVASSNPYDVFVPAKHVNSSGGLNGMHRVATVVSPTKFTIQDLSQKEKTGPMSIGYRTGHNNGFVREMVRSSNITKVAVLGDLGLVAGDNIWVNIYQTNVSPFLGGGFKTILSYGPCAFGTYSGLADHYELTYAETGIDVGPFLQTGVISVYENNPKQTLVAGKAQPVNDPGPFIFDPDFGVNTTSIEGATLSSIGAGAQQGELEISVASGVEFPDSGYVIVGFGTDLQTQPIQYFGKYVSGVSTIKLLIDYNFAFKSSFVAGSKVTLLATRDPFKPQSLVGAAYLTGSSSGRTAAKTAINEAIAAGVDPNVKIIYPGDRGLGGEGSPTSTAEKLSDVVGIWAGDDVDEEIAAAKTGD